MVFTSCVWILHFFFKSIWLWCLLCDWLQSHHWSMRVKCLATRRKWSVIFWQNLNLVFLYGSLLFPTALSHHLCSTVPRSFYFCIPMQFSRKMEQSVQLQLTALYMCIFFSKYFVLDRFTSLGIKVYLIMCFNMFNGNDNKQSYSYCFIDSLECTEFLFLIVLSAKLCLLNTLEDLDFMLHSITLWITNVLSLHVFKF